MRLSIKLLLIFLFSFVCLFAHHKAYSQITIDKLTTYPPSETISQDLIVNDTLIALGDLILANNVLLTINSGGVVIIYGDLITGNKITLDIDSYLFVLGSLKHDSGNDKFVTATVSPDSQVYIFGDLSPHFDKTDLACPDGEYEQGTQNNCGHGNLEDFIRNLDDIPEEITDLFGCQESSMPSYYTNGEPNSNSPVSSGESISLSANAGASYPASIAYYSWEGPNTFYYSSSSTQNVTVTTNAGPQHSGYYIYTAMTTTGCFIRDSTYVLVSDCGYPTGYYSRDNYTGNWSDESSWGVSDNSLAVPPPYDPNSSQTITINGYITLNGSLRLSGSQQYICDTLVVDGIFFADNPTLTIGPNGVLIVLDDYIGTSGSIKNEGQVVFAGEVQNPDSWSVISNAGGTTYILDPDPVGQMPEFSDLDDLKNDQDLYNFYISLVGGVPIITTCPPDAEFACIEDLPIVQNITDFEGIGGEVSDNNDASNLTISYKDVTATASGCRVIRTYTITDKAGNIATCQQEFTIRDNIDPVITCVDLPYMPANDDCSVTISVDKPVINVDTDNCGYGDIEPVYSYHLANNPENEITGMGDIPETNFPLGRTTIHWTFADECGNSVSCTQIIDVNFELSEISYDNGSTATDAGSGVYPMQTSTHAYSVDSKVPEEGYSYEWRLFERNGESLGDVVDPADYVIDQSGAHNSASIAIRFSDTLPKESEYFIAVEKLRNDTQCAKQEVLPIKIYQNDFDVILLPTGSDCQAGETGTPSTILWEISFPEIVTEPFQFDYNITLDGNPICTGTVYGISYSEASLNHNSGCPAENPAVPPYTLVSKNQNSNTVRLEYVVSSITNADLQIGLTIEATDVFEVSDSDISNDTEDITLWGVPNTSDIQTD